METYPAGTNLWYVATLTPLKIEQVSVVEQRGDGMVVMSNECGISPGLIVKAGQGVDKPRGSYYVRRFDAVRDLRLRVEQMRVEAREIEEKADRLEEEVEALVEGVIG
jgi:hypothetical protein